MIYLLLVIFTFVEYNCENLFDTQHDEGKDDYEFLSAADKHWTNHRYWQKINHVSQAIVSCGESDAMAFLPDMAILTEVENDSVMRDLTRRSPLRTAMYDYVMTDGPDKRGIDIALLYSPFSFRLLNYKSFRIHPLKSLKATRDLLYATGIIISGDTLHVLGVHAPSRSGGAAATRPYRMHVAKKLCSIVDSIYNVSSNPLIIVAGDFNDYSKDKSIQLLLSHRLTDISDGAKGSHGAKGTYRYHGEWGSLDHILCSERLTKMVSGCRVNDLPFLLEKDKKYGGVKPRRTYLGPRYLGGFSDHLPIVARLNLTP